MSTVERPARPLIELDPDGSPVVLSYDVPEPTSYRGRQIIELDIDESVFVPPPAPPEPPPPEPAPVPPPIETPIDLTRPSAVPDAPVEVHEHVSGSVDESGAYTETSTRTETSGNVVTTTTTTTVNGVVTSTSSSQAYRDDVLLFGASAPTDRPDTNMLADEAIRAAFDLAKATGYLDPAVFPGVRPATDAFALNTVKEALADTGVTQIKAGNRIVVYRDTSGRARYRFVPEPLKRGPSLLLVEHYRLSSFPARYGAGRTIKTFSLLPGEKTKIRVKTYKSTTERLTQSSSILDATSEETESDFESSVQSEQSNKDASSRSFEYHAEAEAEAKASWGWGSARVKASGGVRGSSDSVREELAKNVTNAVAQNAARASSRRDVQIDSGLESTTETTEQQAIERELANINLSRTLNFVFRQMNQEFISLLHLEDVRVAYFNGYAESRHEVPLPQLDQLLGTYVLPEHQDAVRDRILGELAAITDFQGRPREDFVTTRTLTSGDGVEVTVARVDPGTVSTYEPPTGGEAVTVKGVIVAADVNVMRTDGVVVDTFLGLGNALDDYSTNLQLEAVRAKQIENDREQAELERVKLALELVRSGDEGAVELYRRLFPVTPVLNQIDQATIGTAVEVKHHDGSGDVPQNSGRAL